VKKLIAILAMVAVLSPPVIALSADQTVPNGVQRIGAAGENLDYSAINVAVIDTGVDLANPDINVGGGFDAVRPVPMEFGVGGEEVEVTLPALSADWSVLGNPEATGYDDGVGHGTHVSGIIGASDNAVGVVGVAPGASIWSVRVLGGAGGGSLLDIVAGLDWVYDNRDIIDVVNMSLGADLDVPVIDVLQGCKALYDNGPLTDEQLADLPVDEDGRMRDPLHEAICRVVNVGIPVVVAAGNGNGDVSTVIPAAYGEVFTVSNMVDSDGDEGGLGGILNDPTAYPYGGMDDTLFSAANHTIDQQAGSFSGVGVDFAAPGTYVLSTVPGGWAKLTGTSMASPHVAGAVARYIGDIYGGNLGAYRATRNRGTVGEIYKALKAAAEPQTEGFRDVDDYAEPIIRVMTVERSH
jgi:subtilisin